MFFLYTLEDKILIKPQELNNKSLSYEDIVYSILKAKYLGKILINHGVAVSIKRLILKQSVIVEIEGLINIEYEVDIILMKIEPNDLVFGKIIYSDFNFIIVDCELFKVRIPSSSLMTPCNYDDNENVWYWEYKGHKLYYDLDQKVRVKIIEFKTKTSNEILEISNQIRDDVNRLNKELPLDMLLDVYGTFNQEGLGPIKWWTL